MATEWGVAPLRTAIWYRIVWQDRRGVETSWLIDELEWARSIAGALAPVWKKTVYVVTEDTNEIVHWAAPIPEIDYPQTGVIRELQP